MDEDTVTAKPVTAVSSTAARLSFAGAATFVVLLAMLHLIKAELDPSWHFISEYAIGRYGWIMVLAFISLAVGYVALFVATRSQLRTIAGRTGLALLLGTRKAQLMRIIDYPAVVAAAVAAFMTSRRQEKINV
jgi:hypothetical protein